MKIVPVILSGGSGTRLWPLSRQQYPKQFLSLLGNKSMFQETLLRLKGVSNLADPVIVCNENHRFLVAEQLNQISINNAAIILEPIGRNTAPAITAAAMKIINDIDTKNSIMLVLSADHQINDTDEFLKTINIAKIHAKKGRLVTFGIVPNSPNTGFGYINYFEGLSSEVYEVKKFVEKPDQKTAESYLKDGSYLWNSGMFMFNPNQLVMELSMHSVEIVNAVKKSFDNATQDLDFIRLETQFFESSPSDSIDYALMEKSNNVVVIKLDAGWSDVGSWSSLYEISEKDKNGNVFKGDIFAEETYNSYIDSGSHIIATIGVSNLVIVDTPDATLIASKDQSHKVQKIVKNLQLSDREEHANNRKVFRPWGWYDSIESGFNFQVKRLHINPGAKLSLQMHNKRAEHWVVIDGVANVTNGEKTFTLTLGESTYIPIGAKHSLENKASQTLEIIEVQSGTYLGEDDIVRFEDIYGRGN
ncbi:mannose-1-phosphate guanylyltransferase/mannose-6-phosphate isomerase [Candidatus Thioglobus sp.]|nr:mannose-1-phosphate guanylyltransferase/mannose-6-phosphate isomerase [Candidatus Thioglobus sp.]